MKMQVRNRLKPDCSTQDLFQDPENPAIGRINPPLPPQGAVVELCFSSSSCVSYVWTMEAKSGNKTTEQNKTWIFI